MLKRWTVHLTKGAEKYPEVAPGVSNWTLADGAAEYHRFRESAARHFEQWLNGDRDEDHAAAVFFNINGAEYVLEKGVSLESLSEDPTACGAENDSLKSDTGESAPSTTKSGCRMLGCSCARQGSQPIDDQTSYSTEARLHGMV
jgi:hypothetical protein